MFPAFQAIFFSPSSPSSRQAFVVGDIMSGHVMSHPLKVCLAIVFSSIFSLLVSVSVLPLSVYVLLFPSPIEYVRST